MAVRPEMRLVGEHSRHDVELDGAVRSSLPDVSGRFGERPDEGEDGAADRADAACAVPDEGHLVDAVVELIVGDDAERFPASAANVMEEMLARVLTDPVGFPHVRA